MCVTGTEPRGITGVGEDQRPGRVCLTLPARGRDYDEPVSVLAAVVQELGGEVFTARDGDPSLLTADAVILFGKCSAFDGSAQLLAAHAAQRPSTVLWHVEPLPPRPIPPEAEKAARRLARCDFNRLPQPLPTLVRCVPGHSRWWGLVRWARCRQMVRRYGWDQRADSRSIHPRVWYHAVQHALWLRQRYSRTWCDLVAASTQPRCRVLTEMGIPCEYAPFGYHSRWGTTSRSQRDVDVVFLGRVKGTGRERLLRRIERGLARADVKLVVADQGCYGDQRTELLNRARISLDLTQATWEMPVLRLLTSMACGALVVSNCPLDPYPFRAEYLVRADSDCLEAAILAQLADEPARRRRAEAAYHYLTTELTWRAVVTRVLQRARVQRTAGAGALL
jgi:hypothetical protein